MISDAIQLEYKINYRSILYGFLILAFSIIGNAYIRENISFNEFKDVSVASLFISGIIRIIVYFYASDLIMNLNRNYYFWIFMIIVSPPLALIILGFLEYKIDNPLVKKAVNEIRFEYQHEITALKFRNNTENFEAQCEKIRAQYQLLMKERIDYIIREGKDIEKPATLIKEEDKEISPAERTSFHYDCCPACNFKLIDSPKNCPDCGLSLY